MAELIQHILSLPQPQQLAIVQAIVANIQVHQSPNSNEVPQEVWEAQIQRIESIIEAYKNGKVSAYTEEELWQHIDQVKETQKNG